jgi:hypothetical protein
MVPLESEALSHICTVIRDNSDLHQDRRTTKAWRHLVTPDCWEPSENLLHVTLRATFPHSSRVEVEISHERDQIFVPYS